MTAYESILDRLGDAVGSRNGNQAEARCPAHEDRRASLSVGVRTEGDPGAVVKCHAGCVAGEVLAALDLPTGALYDSWWERRNGSGRRIVATYNYTDEQEQLLFQTVRYVPKDFHQRRPDGNGGWIWKLGDVRRVLYRLPKVIEAIKAGETIYVAEGEECVHAIERAGGVATCNPMGAGKGKWRREYADVLANAPKVIVVADRDEAGRKHAEAIVASLPGAVLVEAKKGNDARDHLGAGHGLDDFAPVELFEPVETAGATFQLLSVQDLLVLPDPEWVIDGLMPEGLIVLFGPPSSYKSFIGLDWAMCIATGLPWQEREVKPGHVVYVAAEGRGGLKNRVAAWLEANGEPDASRMHFLPEAVNLLDRDQVERVRKTIALLPEPPKLLVIDTMARAIVGGDENSARDVGQFITAVGGQNAAARLVVHHTGKDGALERGSGALRGAADMMARVDRDGQEPQVAVTCDKPPKDGPSWEAMTLRRELVGDSLVITPVPVLTTAMEAHDERRKTILAFIEDNEPVSRNKIEKGVGGKASLVRDALERLYIEGAVDMVQQGQSKLYSLPRPSLGDEVGTRSPQVPGDRTSSPGGEEDVVLPGRDEVVRTSSLVPVPTTGTKVNDPPQNAILGYEEER